jgi:L-ectoine synthase
MIVRSLQDVIGTERDVSGKGWRSRRIILKRDGMGCSVHDTVVLEGTELRMQYKHHLETNYCIEGEGEVEEVATGKIHPLKPGTVYALDKNDPHIVRALKGDLRVVCVFFPALSGNETHDAEGGYGPPTD